MAYSMTIKVESGISADGFSVEIFEDGKSISRQTYRYGYNASHSPSGAAKSKPYVRDIVSSYRNLYQPWKIETLAGENTFAGRPVSEDRVQQFIRDYIE